MSSALDSAVSLFQDESMSQCHETPAKKDLSVQDALLENLDNVEKLYKVHLSKLDDALGTMEEKILKLRASNNVKNDQLQVSVANVQKHSTSIAKMTAIEPAKKEKLQGLKVHSTKLDNDNMPTSQQILCLKGELDSLEKEFGCKSTELENIHATVQELKDKNAVQKSLLTQLSQ